MKKHLSNETYVEHFKIDIPANVPQNFIKCRNCNSMVERKICFNVTKNSPSVLAKNKNKRLMFCSFSTIDSSFDL